MYITLCIMCKYLYNILYLSFIPDKIQKPISFLSLHSGNKQTIDDKCISSKKENKKTNRGKPVTLASVVKVFSSFPEPFISYPSNVTSESECQTEHTVNAFYSRLFNQNALYLRESLRDMIKEPFQKKKIKKC